MSQSFWPAPIITHYLFSLVLLSHITTNPFILTPLIPSICFRECSPLISAYCHSGPLPSCHLPKDVSPCDQWSTHVSFSRPWISHSCSVCPPCCIESIYVASPLPLEMLRCSHDISHTCLSYFAGECSIFKGLKFWEEQIYIIKLKLFSLSSENWGISHSLVYHGVDGMCTSVAEVRGFLL